MSYLDQAHDPRRRAKAVLGVGAIHAVLAYGIVTGLGAEIVDRFVPPPLIGQQIPLPPPPPDPPPKASNPIVETPVAPRPQIEPLTPIEPRIEVVINDVRPFDGIDTDPRPPLPPLQPPRPSFTPKRAAPSNNSAGWITSDDYPRRALVDEAEGSVGYRLVIGTTGRVSSCELTRPSGNRALDDATCRLIASRARFEPATDETGARVLGTFSGSVRWEIPE